MSKLITPPHSITIRYSNGETEKIELHETCTKEEVESCLRYLIEIENKSMFFHNASGELIYLNLEGAKVQCNWKAGRFEDEDEG